jgi:hypothetical protein
VKDATVVRSGSSVVGLRHDVDTVYGLRWGLPKIISIEKKHDVKSTFFVHIDVIRSDKDKRALKRIADEGWEIGLHLINTINDSGLLSPEGELKLLKKLLDVPIYGVTSCGSTIGEKEGYQKFKEDLLQQLSQNGIATVLVHPEGFVRSVQSHGLLKVPLTLLRKGMINKVYDNFLYEFKNKVKFKKYIDIC